MVSLTVACVIVRIVVKKQNKRKLNYCLLEDMCE